MNETLTPKEAGQYLKLHLRTIYHLAKQGLIPALKAGGRWKFRKDTLNEWLSGRKNCPLKESIEELHFTEETKNEPFDCESTSRPRLVK